MDELTEMVQGALAEMFAYDAANRNRLECECSDPMPEQFDHFDWTVCQKCCKRLSRLRAVEFCKRRER